MSAAKSRSSKPSFGDRLRGGLGRLLRALMPPLLLIGAIIGASYMLWQAVGPFALANHEFDLTAERINVTPPPSWVRSDIKQEVLRDASLDGGVSILDADLAERVAKAFQLHPWVARVESVRKVAPSGVVVELIYRRPVCMVEVPGGLYAVDADAVLLPSADFTPAEAKRYPRLSSIHAITAGPVGTPWPDEQVRAGARIAAVLLEAWESLNLNRLTPVAGGEFEVFTARGTCIHWGPAGTNQSADLAEARNKLERLTAFAASHGGLDAAAEVQDIDLRQPGEIKARPRVVKSDTPLPDGSSPPTQGASLETRIE